MSAEHNSLKLEPLHAPEHAVWPELIVKPSLQLLHMDAPCLVQVAPVFGEPFGQVHMLAARDTQMCLWLGAHLARCMAGTTNVTRVDTW